jgi:hypothetical protein
MVQKSLVKKVLGSPWFPFLGFHTVHRDGFDREEYAPMKVINNPMKYLLNLYYHIGWYMLLAAGITYTVTRLSSN